MKNIYDLNSTKNHIYLSDLKPYSGRNNGSIIPNFNSGYDPAYNNVIQNQIDNGA